MPLLICLALWLSLPVTSHSAPAFIASSHWAQRWTVVAAHKLSNWPSESSSPNTSFLCLPSLYSTAQESSVHCVFHSVSPGSYTSSWLNGKLAPTPLVAAVIPTCQTIYIRHFISLHSACKLAWLKWSNSTLINYVQTFFSNILTEEINIEKVIVEGTINIITIAAISLLFYFLLLYSVLFAFAAATI